MKRMKANQGPRARAHAAQRTPDGGQMLLLAGFLLAATAIIALGALTMVQRSETQMTAQEHQSMLELFLNTRERAIDYFELVDEDDNAESATYHLDGYLASQFQTANALNLDMNATLVSADARSDLSEVDFTDDQEDYYKTPEGNPLWDVRGTTSFSDVCYDEDDDGLLMNDQEVLGAIFWVRIEGIDAVLEEYIVIDVPATEPPTDPPASC